MTAKLTEALAAFDASMADIGGCSNHDCRIVKPKGMGTNGGCKCLRGGDHFRAEWVAQAARRLRNAVEAAIQ